MEKPSEQQLRTEILDRVREYYYARHLPEEFIPGQTPVRFGGRIFDAEELVNLVDAALDFWLTEDRYSTEFTKAFSKKMGVKYVVLANSGSSANLLAFTSLLSPNLGERRLHPADEVITAAAAFPTTVNPIIQNRCIPVFVDITIGTYNIDVNYLEEALSERTRAVFLAHTLGNPFDLDTVMAFAKSHNLLVIEDACDALGSTYRGQLVGTFSDLSTYSFYPAHHITMGEGGAIITQDSRLFRAVQSLRNWGRDCWCLPGVDNTCGKRFGWKLGRLPYGYDHKHTYTHIGYNLKPLDLQPAIGVAQLNKLPAFVEARRRNFARLYEGLKHYDHFFFLPQATEGSDPSWFGFPLSLRPDAPFTRAEIVRFLEDHKIMTRMLFAGNILCHPAYLDIDCRVVGTLPQTEYAMEHTFWVGIYPGLNDVMLDYMIDTFDEFLQQW